MGHGSNYSTASGNGGQYIVRFLGTFPVLLSAASSIGRPAPL